MPKKILLIFMVFLPSAIKIFILNRLFNAKIDKTAKIGMSYIHAKHIKIGAYSRIGHFNVIRNIEIFDIGEYSNISSFNQFKALPLGSTIHFSHEKDRLPSFSLGNHSAISKHNYFDCNNSISIGSYSAIAGFRSYFFTHGVNPDICQQQSKPIVIGNYCRVATCSVITKGSILPNYSVLGANSTLSKAYTQEYTLYSGVPAIPVKKYNPDAKYFTRTIGFVE